MHVILYSCKYTRVHTASSLLSDFRPGGRFMLTRRVETRSETKSSRGRYGIFTRHLGPRKLGPRYTATTPTCCNSCCNVVSLGIAWPGLARNQWVLPAGPQASGLRVLVLTSYRCLYLPVRAGQLINSLVGLTTTPNTSISGSPEDRNLLPMPHDSRESASQRTHLYTCGLRTAQDLCPNPKMLMGRCSSGRR